jgi:hypothetical protein
MGPDFNPVSSDFPFLDLSSISGQPEKLSVLEISHSSLLLSSRLFSLGAISMPFIAAAQISCWRFRESGRHNSA